MGKSGQSLGAALALVLLLAFATPARTQDAQEPAPDENGVQSASPGDSEVQPEPKETKPAAATHHTAKKKHKATHKKHTKKKKAHKAAKKRHAKKSAKKQHAAAHRKKPVKKTTEAKPKKAKEVEQAPLSPVNPAAKTEINEPEKAQEAEKETAVPKAAAPAAAAIPAVIAPKDTKEPAEAKAPEETTEPAKEPEETKTPAKIEKKAEAEKPAHKTATNKKAAAAAPAARKTKTASAGGKTVTYTFCLGYDNCTPYRYEAMVHGGVTDAKIFKENPEGGGWVETKIDPVMESDLATMARSESGSDVARPLTVTEKARIADHQGKAHVDLVAAANDGRKDQVKQMMKDLRISNADELTAYDARLAKNATALQAANELAAGR